RRGVPEALVVQDLQDLLAFARVKRAGLGPRRRAGRARWWRRLAVCPVPARAGLAGRPARAGGPGDRDQRGGGHLGQPVGSLSLVALSVASSPSSAESSPWTSITLRARSSWSRSRALSRSSRASFRSRGSAGGRPRRWPSPSPARAPLSRCLRHSEISEVYRPSRRSSAPLPALSSCSYSARIRSL